MREVIRLVQDIRSFLNGTPGSSPAEALAPAYARFREEAASRLEACAAMLEKGSEYQVLQLAETEPPLLDLVAQLMFAEEPKWITYCGEHQLTAPRPFDVKAVQALNDIYNKGISPNSSLYKDYRAAVSSRNEDRAFQIIRSIARLNPSDADAKAEMERMRNKKMLSMLDNLKPLLAAGEKDAVAALVEEIEELETEDKLIRHDIYNQAASVRKDVMRRRGELEAVALLDTSENLRMEFDWKGVSVNVTRIRSLQNERQIAISQDQSNRLMALERYVEKQREEAREQAEFNRVLAALSSYADKVDTRLMTAATMTIPEAQKLESGFADHWKKVEIYQRAVPEGDLARLQGIGASIRQEADRLRGAKKARRLSLAAAVILFLFAGAWAGYVALRAYQYVQQLEDLHVRKMAAAAGKLVEDIPGTAPWGATSMPALRAKMEEIRQWSKNEQIHLEQTESLLSELEKASTDQFAGMEPAVLRQKVAAAAENVQNLAADLVASGKDRLARVQNKVDQHFTEFREKSAAEAEKQLAELSKFADGLSFEQPSIELASTLAKIDPPLQDIEKRLGGRIPELRLPPEIEAAASKLRGQIDPFLKELASLWTVSQSMTNADTLDAYKAALLEYSKLRLIEAGVSAPILANFPSSDGVASKILFGGDESSWEAVKQDTQSGFKFRPDDVLNNELQDLLTLRDDPMLNQIWEVMVTNLKTEKSRMVWSNGKLDETNSGFNKRWAGSIYDPSTLSLRPAFMDEKIIVTQFTDGKRIGEIVTTAKPSANTRFMASLKLNRITDPNGDHYEIPLLQVLDAVLQSTEGSVLAKAYVFQRICQLIKIRPYQWGLHYCPVLVDDMAKLDTLLQDRSLHSDDWMVPDARTRLETPLTQFLQAAASHPPYLKMAGEYRRLAITVRDAGINYVGYLDDHYQAHLKSKGIAATELWAIAEQGGLPIRLTFENGQMKSDASKSSRKWSPLFMIAIDRDVATNRISNGTGQRLVGLQTQPVRVTQDSSHSNVPLGKSTASSTDSILSPSDQLKTDKETTRQLQRVQEARSAINKGDRLLPDGDLEGAVNEYKTAIDLLPEAPTTQVWRDLATAKFCDTAVSLAHQRASAGRNADALALVNEVLARNPEHKKGILLSKQLTEAGISRGALNKATTTDPIEICAHKLKTIIFPKVQFQGASLEEAIEFVRIKSKDLDMGESDPQKRGVSIILKLGSTPSTVTLSLDLKNVPLEETLRYIVELAGLVYDLTAEGVVVRPK